MKEIFTGKSFKILKHSNSEPDPGKNFRGAVLGFVTARSLKSGTMIKKSVPFFLQIFKACSIIT